MIWRRVRFTLVELLVVIAIILILVSLLLPALREMKESVERVCCASNLKQAGVCLFNYASDNNETFPRSSWDQSKAVDVFRANFIGYDLRPSLLLYLKSLKSWRCPGLSSACPIDNYQANQRGDCYGTYFYFPGRRFPAFGASGTPDRINKFYQGKWVLMQDRLSMADDGNFAFNHGRGPVSQPYSNNLSFVFKSSYSPADPKGANLLFGDSHVEWAPPGNLKNVGNTTNVGTTACFSLFP